MENVQSLFDKLLKEARTQFGPAVFKYRKVPHVYRKGKHWVSCVKHEEITREEYLNKLEESKLKRHLAFNDKLKSSYDEVTQEVSIPGYLQRLEEMIKEEIKKEKGAPEESLERPEHQPTAPACH